MNISALSVRQKLISAALIGFVVGVVWFIALRFFSYTNTDTHYHANFALYINGQRDELSSFTFYEEVQSCGSDEINNPRTRVHLHDKVNHTAHVHDPASTWGHLFANLGYTLGDKVLQTDEGVYSDKTGGAELSFWLNGEEVDGVSNRTIRSEDALLISYGTDDQSALQQRYEGIVKDAAEYNKRNDPSACTGTKPKSTWERLKAAMSLK